jgi:hypothetical protein
MSVTVVEKMFSGAGYNVVYNAIREWIIEQIPELTLVKTGKSGNDPWWLYKFGNTDYGLSFYNYKSLWLSVACGITDKTTGANQNYQISTSVIKENNSDVYKAGAAVIRTPQGVIIQGINYTTGKKSESFCYLGKTESVMRGPISVAGYFSSAGYLYSNQNDLYLSKVDGSLFYFKIDNETPAVWRHGALTAIRPSGTAYGAAGSIVASAVYGVTSAAWMDPIRIDAFYALDGPVFPPYYTEVTAGGRKMQRVGKELLLEG